MQDKNATTTFYSHCGNRLHAVLFIVLGLILAVGAVSCSSGDPGEAEAEDQVVTYIGKIINQGTGWRWLSGAKGGSERTAIGATSEQTAWVLADGGFLWKTTDGGNSWELRSLEFPHETYGVFPLDADICWLIGDGGLLYKTLDGGSIWSEIDTGGPFVMRIIEPVDGLTTWAIGRSHEILKTADGGSTWTSQFQSEEGSLELYDIDAVDAATAWAVGSDGHILKTVDGKEWSLQITTTVDLVDISAVDENTAWVVGEEAAILSTSDGGESWISHDADLPLYYKNRIYAVDADTAWVVNDYKDGCWKTADGVASWSEEKIGEGERVYEISVVDPEHLWALTESGSALRSDNGGASWNERMSPAIKDDLASVEICDDTVAWVMGTGGVVYYSNDSGGHWDIPDFRIPRMRCITAAASDSLWALGDDGGCC